jgi:isochorismate hydrolase
MGIPQIENYTLRDPELRAVNVVAWQKHDDRSVLLVHDMQKYFLEMLPQPLRGELIDNCRQLVAHARERGIPIVYTAQRGDMSTAERGLLFDIWGRGMSSRSDHTGIADELALEPEDTVLAKWRYSAFHSTPLRETFKRHGRDQIIICGVYAHIGVLASAIDAYSNDIQVFLVQDAMADFSKQVHAQALAYAAECCAKVLSTREVCQ